MNDETSNPTPVDDDRTPFARVADEAHLQGAFIAPAAPVGTARRPWSPKRRVVAFGSAAALLLGAGTGIGVLSGTALAAGNATTTTGTGGSTGSGAAGGSGSTGGGSTGSGSTGSGSTGTGNGFGSFGNGFGQGSTDGGSSSGGSSSGGFGSGGSDSSGSGSTTVSGTAATTEQKRGVVTIVSELKYEGATSAGTGIVLTSNGRILTNNHVVSGATSIKVTDETTDKTYTAKVVGTDATHDIAVLQLTGASGLTTKTIATGTASVGDDVTAVGNAEGGGTLIAAKGDVTALKQAITTASEGSAASEKLKGLIETDADIVSGDSGGPLLNSAGEVVGIDTAASSGTKDTTGYAITIASALSIADDIVAGKASDTITIGYPAFLGVEVSPTATTATGATVGGVISGTPADTAGLEAGDVVTKVNDKSLTDAASLSTVLHRYSPGSSVSITYTDTEGGSHTATVTLVAGPAA